jgi:hypothetical protein
MRVVPLFAIVKLSIYLQICKPDMITMFPNSLIRQHNVNWKTRHITMEVVSADSSCSVQTRGLVGCKALQGGVYRVRGIIDSQALPQSPYGTLYVRKNSLIYTYYIIAIAYTATGSRAPFGRICSTASFTWCLVLVVGALRVSSMYPSMYLASSSNFPVPPD